MNQLSAAAGITFLTASHAVSVFPRETFLNRKTYACNKRTFGKKDRSWEWITGYFGTSCTLVDSPLVQLITVIPREMTTGMRQIGDTTSWVVKFNKGMEVIIVANIVANSENRNINFCTV